MNQLRIFTLLLAAFALLFGCQTNDQQLITSTYSPDELRVLSSNLDLPDFPYDYGLGNSSSKSEVNHKATLGRVLFYDKKLSSDGKVSCASCHQQALGFADNQAQSEGPNGNVTDRNSIALASLRNFGVHYDKTIDGRETPGLFWDERASSIKEQLKQTINNPNEMGMELHQISNLIENTDHYQILHEKAFGNTAVSEDHILEALETFINSISSTNSEFEGAVVGSLNYITGDSVVGETKFERGLQLFAKHCTSCHGQGMETISEIANPENISVANNGLKHAANDLGVYQHTGKLEDIGKFKIPGLHNIELTAPYMHDGRFATLEEVVDFYNSEIEFHENLHPSLRNGNEAKRMNMNEEEKTALVEFLKSLTDEKMITEVKWSDPFVR